MYRHYNQSREVRERHSRLNPEFWEIGVDHDRIGRFSASEGMYYESEEDVAYKEENGAWVEKTYPGVIELMKELLTDRQQRIVKLYFLDQMTEREIAGMLGISAASVSQHLFGKMRNGKRVGGAIPKLRKHVGGASGLSAFRTG